MKKILVICYYFPPLGGAGVGRPLALFKYLSNFGYQCHLLTVKPVAYRLFEPELLDELDTSHVYRSGSLDPQRLLHLCGLRRVKDKVIRKGRSISDRFFPDSKVGWVKPALRLGRQLVSNHEYHAIVSSSPPISCHLVGQQLSRETGLPLIADFRDYWTSYPVEEAFANPKLVARGKSLLDRIKKDVYAVTTVNQTIANYLQTDNIIPNSYDQELAALWKPTVDDESFIIGLYGTFSDIYPVDPLLKTLDQLRSRSRECFERVRVLQIGNVDPEWLRPQLERYNLVDHFELVGFLPRHDSIVRASASSIFYLGLPSEKESAFTTGRIYYLLASGRPILAAVPGSSEIARLVSESGQGCCFQSDSMDGAVEYLRQGIIEHRSGPTAVSILPDYARKYSAEQMVARFADLLDSIPA